MSKIEIIGTLRDGGKDYKPGHMYLLDAPRKSDTVDTLMVFASEELPEGPVKVTGTIRAEYIRDIGVPTFIVPEKIETLDGVEPLNDVSLTGSLKKVPVCRKTKKEQNISTVLLVTDDGTVPVLLWGDTAKEAPDKYKAGDRLTVRGRLQSREYPAGESRKTVWELSARKVSLAKEG